MNTVEKITYATTEIQQTHNEQPFVLGIQNGILDKDKLRYYIIQDYLGDYVKSLPWMQQNRES